MKISINEPCHENWEAMTPNQQGAFCGSCQKNVVDFSKKTIQEIKDFFSKPKEGRVCGRFDEKQLQELSFDDFFARFRYWSFGKKFATIFILAFGFWIFSNSSALAQEQHLKGEVAIEQPKQVKQPVSERKTVKGKIAVNKTVCEAGEPKKDKEPKVNKQAQHHVMGMVAYIPRDNKKIEPTPVHTIDQEPQVKTTQAINKTPVVKTVDLVSETEEINIIQPVRRHCEIQAVQLTKVIAEDPKPSLESKTLVYPNPTSGVFMVESPEKQTLRVFDMTGRLVLTQAVNGLSKIDASQLENGAYSLLFTGVKGSFSKKLIITR